MQSIMKSAISFRWVLMLWVLAFSNPTFALTYLVGAGAVPSVCDHNTLQAAINAAASNPGVDFIRVASDQSYTAQALTIGQQDLTITGGYATCTAALPVGALPTGSTIISGAGGAAAPVFSITGSGVRVLSNLQIRNGDDVQINGSGCGGGVRFVGLGELLIRNTGISQNTANHGGGICFTGTGTPAALTIEGEVIINNNVATTGNGGGIAIGGSARLFALKDRTLISSNQALSGHGGGVYVQAPARADIGSPGYNGLGVLYANEALRGGGLAGYALEGSDYSPTCIRMFTTDATRPVRIQQNRASEFGGAFYLRSNQNVFSNTEIWLRAYDLKIDGNTAVNGPAGFLQGDDFLGDATGSRLLLNTGYPQHCNEPLFELGRVPCTDVAQCNRIENNRAENFNGTPSNGNVLEFRLASNLDANNLSMINNQGTRLLNSASGDFATIALSNCALISNTVSQELVRISNQLWLDFTDCTIAGNVIGGTHVLRQDGDNFTSLINSLIDQPGKLTLSHPNVVPFGKVTNQWVLAKEVGSLLADPTVRAFQGNGGRFVDTARGNYRLRIGSEGVDFAPPPTPLIPGEMDLDRRPRNIDLGEATANTRARDLGPYERQFNDPWLLNGDFVSDLRLWANPNVAHSTFDAANNAPGSNGGSLLFNVPVEQVGPTERRNALSQCFNVPSSGEYQIHAKALVPGGTALTRDYPIVNWRLRYNSENCVGAEAASGDAFLDRSPTVWQTFSAPLVVTVDSAQWTWNTTLEIRLDVAQNQGSPVATALIARFDDIEISKYLDDLFANSFEQ